MSSLSIAGDSSGQITLSVPAVAGNNTVTIAAQTGTLNAAGPAFSAYQSSAQSALASNTDTKLVFQTEIFDTNNCFDNVTNYRFLPTVAGYYQISGCFGTASSVVGYCYIYKNGSVYVRGSSVQSAQAFNSTVSTLIYFNGATDYVELWGRVSSSSAPVADQTQTWFTGCLIRGA